MKKFFNSWIGALSTVLAISLILFGAALAFAAHALKIETALLQQDVRLQQPLQILNLQLNSLPPVYTDDHNSDAKTFIDQTREHQTLAISIGEFEPIYVSDQHPDFEYLRHRSLSDTIVLRLVNEKLPYVYPKIWQNVRFSP
ncbi:MAG TPA: hypothetical protein VLE93_01320 [Candidatus Saccharimonadales bacterium]|nr:hypothetical protein [Candidatus Saccharimonadales bacterium]